MEVCMDRLWCLAASAILALGGSRTLSATTGSSVHAERDVQLRSAQFNRPTGIAVDHDGNLYVADTGNHAIRKITPTGTVTTLAGMAGTAGISDGVGGAARFVRPEGIAVD